MSQMYVCDTGRSTGVCVCMCTEVYKHLCEYVNLCVCVGVCVLVCVVCVPLSMVCNIFNLTACSNAVSPTLHIE